MGSLVLVAALSWQPLALLIDTVMHWPNIAMGLSQVALVACAAGTCVMITTVASGHKPGFAAGFDALKPYFDEMFLGRRDVAASLAEAQQAANSAAQR